MSRKTKTIIIAIVVLAAIGFIGKEIEGEKKNKPVETKKDNPKSPTRTEAYIIAKQFAKEHLGSADYGFVDDGFTDYGDGTFHVTGVADIPGERIRWTVEIEYKGGDVYSKSNWVQKGWYLSAN